MSNTTNASLTNSELLTESHSLTDSVTTRGRAHARAYTREDGITEIRNDDNTLKAVQIADLADYYKRTFGSYCPACARRDMAAAIEQGMTMDVIIIAMDEAAIAPRPSWAYARAIIRRCLMEHICTEDDYTKGQINYTRTGGRKGHELPF